MQQILEKIIDDNGSIPILPKDRAISIAATQTKPKDRAIEIAATQTKPAARLSFAERPSQAIKISPRRRTSFV